MKSMIQRYLTIVAFIIITISVKAQDYNQAFKLKGFSPWGISYKILTGFENGYEFSYQKLRNSHSLTSLRIYQEPLVPKLSSKWFLCYGFGAHATLYNAYSTYNPFTPFDKAHHYDKTFVAMGLDGYAGIEYRFLKHPFIVSADIIPNFEFFGPNFFKVNMNSFCTGIAYVF